MRNIQKITNKFRNIIYSYVDYIKQKRISKKNNTLLRNKALILQIENPAIYHRYFYTFIKFFNIAGFDIYYPLCNYNFYRRNFYNRNKNSSNYFNLIFEEGLLNFRKPSYNYKLIHVIQDINITADYFTNLLQENIDEGYYIPMTLHPLFYFNNIWNVNYFSTNKKRSIFMIGCIDKKSYEVFDENIFGMENRYKCYKHLLENNLIDKFDNLQELIFFLKSSRDKACIIIGRNEFEIKMVNLRKIISKFAFYLTLPGVVMPFTHNIVEALSVGSIPIIHKNYAKLFRPNLKHMVNAIIYQDLTDLEFKMKDATSLSKEQVKKISENAYEYYKTYMSPEKVVSFILENKKIYLQAEHLSVSILKNNLT